MQTAVVRRGDLVLSTNGAGTLVPVRESALGFKSGGELVELLVQVGDEVERGQLLARLDDSSAQQQLRQAELDLAELTSPGAVAQARLAAAEAETAVEKAQDDLKYLISNGVFNWEIEVAAADLALAGAQEAAASSATPEMQQALEEAEAALEAAKDTLARKWRYYENVYGPDNFTIFDRQTRSSYVDWPTEAEIEAARAALAIAEAKHEEAGLLVAVLNGEPVPEGATGEGLVKLEQGRYNLEGAKDSLADTQLVAPFAGTITAVEAQVGDSLGSSSFITLTDLSQPHVEIFLDEIDLNMIDVGYKVEIVLDALPEEVFTGVVVEVDLNLGSLEGARGITGLAAVDNPAAFQALGLPMGLSATVEVISGQVEGALLVPEEALRELSPGEYAVFVVIDGEPRLRPVEVGLTDMIYAEITSGLEQGDVVSTGIVETQ